MQKERDKMGVRSISTSQLATLTLLILSTRQCSPYTHSPPLSQWSHAHPPHWVLMQMKTWDFRVHLFSICHVFYRMTSSASNVILLCAIAAHEVTTRAHSSWNVSAKAGSLATNSYSPVLRIQRFLLSLKLGTQIKGEATNELTTNADVENMAALAMADSRQSQVTAAYSKPSEQANSRTFTPTTAVLPETPTSLDYSNEAMPQEHTLSGWHHYPFSLLSSQTQQLMVTQFYPLPLL